MRYRLSVLALAVDDIDKSRRFYNDQSPNLGLRFRNTVATQLRRIREKPLMFPAIDAEGRRRAMVRKFPFGIFFTVDGDKIVVFAVHDLRRDSSRWRSRL